MRWWRLSSAPSSTRLSGLVSEPPCLLVASLTPAGSCTCSVLAIDSPRFALWCNTSAQTERDRSAELNNGDDYADRGDQKDIQHESSMDMIQIGGVDIEATLCADRALHGIQQQRMSRADELDRDASDFQIADQGPCDEKQPLPFSQNLSEDTSRGRKATTSWC